jgi:hypothetical protein
VGVAESALVRTPLTLVFPGEFELRAPALPRPLHLLVALLRARGFTWTDRIAVMRLMTRLNRVRPGMTVARLLDDSATDRCRTPFPLGPALHLGDEHARGRGGCAGVRQRPPGFARPPA